MDGSNHTILLNGSSIGWPNGLAIEYQEDFLYWADAKTDMIEKMRFDGSQRTVVIARLRHPFGLDVFKDRILFSDWQDKSIYSISRSNVSNVEILRRNLVGLMEVQVYDKSKQQGR